MEDFIRKLKTVSLKFNFLIIYINQKILLLLKNHLNYLLKIIFSNAFLRSIIRIIFLKNQFSSKHIMMENTKPEEEKIIKDIRNLFRLKKELNYTTIKDIRNFFRLEKETKAIKDGIRRDIKNLFEYEEEKEIYYKTVRISNFWSNNYIQYESNGDRNKTLSVEEYLNNISQYLKDIIINILKKSDTKKIQK